LLGSAFGCSAGAGGVAFSAVGGAAGFAGGFFSSPHPKIRAKPNSATISKIPILFMLLNLLVKLALPWPKINHLSKPHPRFVKGGVTGFINVNIMPFPAVSTKHTPIKRLKSFPARQKLFCKSRKIETLVPYIETVIKNQGNTGDLEIV
jgi:hypothetical protein